MMPKRSNHRVQNPKPRDHDISGFAWYRPVNIDSAEKLYEFSKEMIARGKVPEGSTPRQPNEMRLTYIEKGKLEKQLRAFAVGWDARGAIQEFDRRCETHNQPLEVGLGRVALFGARKQVLSVTTEHDQTVADEYLFAVESLELLHVKGLDRRTFRPHISLFHLPHTSPLGERNQAMHAVNGNLHPMSIILDEITVYPDRYSL